LHVQAFDGVGGVNDLADLGRVRKKRDHLVPHPTPRRHDGRQLLAPRAGGKRLEPFGRQFGRFGAVDTLEFLGHRLALLPAAKGQRITDQVHDAGLHLGFREHRRDGFRKAFQAVNDRD
jgi:hypothetical protein